MKLFLTISIFAFYTSAFSQIKPNSIGFCFIKQNSDEIIVEVSFPFESLQSRANNSKFSMTTNLKIYNRNNLLIDLNKQFEFSLEIWCDNDGGSQYRPSTTISISSDQFKSEFQPNIDYEKFLGFVILDQTSINDLEDFEIQDNSVFVLDIDNDKNPEAIISTYYDDAENCDERLDNHQMMHLICKEGDFRMRCCGP